LRGQISPRRILLELISGLPQGRHFFHISEGMRMIVRHSLRAVDKSARGPLDQSPDVGEKNRRRASRDDSSLEGLRDYLLIMARLQVQLDLRWKIDPSGVVQQTLLDAHQAGARFRTSPFQELAGWLRKALAANLADAVRYVATKRDARRERSLHAAGDASSARLQGWPAADNFSFSARLGEED